MYTHNLSDVLWYDVAGSWSDLRSVLESVRFFCTFSSRLDHAEEVAEPGSVKSIARFPELVMRDICSCIRCKIFS